MQNEGPFTKMGLSSPKKQRLGVRWKRSLQRYWILYLLLIIPLAWLIIFCYTPMFGVTIAFKDYSVRLGYFGSKWVGLKHFMRFFESAMFGRLIKNTVILSLYSLFAEYVSAIVLAMMVHEIRNRTLKKTIQMASYLPYFISTVIVVAMMQQLFSLRGVVNQFLALLGLPTKSFFNTPNTFRHMFVWSGVWSGVGYSSVIYIAALAKVDTSLYEAAWLDGANRLQKIRHVDLPSIAPTMIILLILRLSGVMSVSYEKAYLMQTNINLGVSEVISTYVYQVGIVSHQMSFSAAVGFFNSVINVIFLLLANVIAKKVSETSLW